MLRLAIIGGDPGVFRRLRGAVAAPAEDCDAVVVLSGDVPPGRRVLFADIDALAPKHLDMPPTVANPDRFLPSRRLIREKLYAGLGEPGLVRIHRWSPRPVPPTRDVDMALWLMGRAPDVVHAVRGDGVSQIHLGFPGGGMALVSHAHGPALGEYTSLSVIAADGAAHADDHVNHQLLFKAGVAHAVPTDEGDIAVASMIQGFIDGAPADDRTHWRSVFAVLEEAGR